jgi:hypothetical protein
MSGIFKISVAEGLEDGTYNGELHANITNITKFIQLVNIIIGTLDFFTKRKGFSQPMGTTAHAIAAGPLQIIRPTEHDQPDNLAQSQHSDKYGVPTGLA